MKMPESQVSCDELKITQSELHEKGCLLTKVWSDLFSLLSKYQADLIVKENEIELLEEQLESKQKLLKATPENDGREAVSLQGELQMKDLELTKNKADLINRDDELQRLRTELRNNSEQLTKYQAEALENQSMLIKTRSENDKLKFEMTSKEEMIRIKDNLLEKIQSQMMREVSDISAEVNSLKQQLMQEKKAHEATKRATASKRNQGTNDVIQISDSPPMMDLSCEATEDFNVLSASNAGDSLLNVSSPKKRRFPGASSSTSTPFQSQNQFEPTPSFPDIKGPIDNLPSITSTYSISASNAWSSNSPSSALSRLQDQQENDNSLSIDGASFKVEDLDPVPVSLSGPLSLNESEQETGMDPSQPNVKNSAKTKNQTECPPTVLAPFCKDEDSFLATKKEVSSAEGGFITIEEVGNKPEVIPYEDKTSIISSNVDVSELGCDHLDKAQTEGRVEIFKGGRKMSGYTLQEALNILMDKNNDTLLLDSIPLGCKENATFLINMKIVSRKDLSADDCGVWGKPSGDKQYLVNKDGKFVKVDKGVKFDYALVRYYYRLRGTPQFRKVTYTLYDDRDNALKCILQYYFARDT